MRVITRRSLIAVVAVSGALSGLAALAQTPERGSQYDAQGRLVYSPSTGRVQYDDSQSPAAAEPRGLDQQGLAVAAAVVEMMAARHGTAPASWTAVVPAAPHRVFLVQAAESLPRLRKLCEEEGPEPLRRRGLLAPPEFLTAA